MLTQYPVQRRQNKLYWLLLLLVPIVVVAGLLVQRPPAAPPLPSFPAEAQLPLAFEPNVGQSDTAVLYQGRGLGGNIFFTQTGITYALPDGMVSEMAFVGANEGAAVTAVSLLPGTVNYFRGSDPDGWQQSVPTYETVRYEGLYAGIDADFDGLTGTLKGTYTVAPQADPAQIRWAYPLATTVNLDGAGNLLIGVAGAAEPLMEQAPVAWQVVDGEKTAVAVSFALAADGTVGFDLGLYNPTLPLIIDPTVTFSSFYGGSAEECLFDRCSIAVDDSGNIILVGTTNSLDFPTVNEYASDTADGSGEDIFVVKLAPNGSSVIFSTYIGDGDARGVDLDSAGNIYLTGATSSATFPTTATKISDCDNGILDLVVAKLSADGTTLLYSSCIGGDSFDIGYDIVVDSSGNMVVAGYSLSENFPVQNAAQPTLGGGEDAIVLKLNAQGSALIYSTFWGGERRDWAYGVDLDSMGNAYFGGRASSEDFPTTSGVLREDFSGSLDGFVAKVSPTGEMLYSTLTALGATRPNREVADVVVDDAGYAYVLELGTSFRGVRKFNPTGTQQLYQTEIEMDTAIDGQSRLAIDSLGRVVVAGQRNGTFDGGDKEVLVAGLAENGRLVYEETFGADDFARGTGVALFEHDDGRLDAYIVGATDDAQFPTANPVQGTLNGTRDVIVFNLTNLQDSLVARDIYLPFVIKQ